MDGSVFQGIGRVSTIVADAAAHPAAQLAVLAACVSWMAAGASETTLASTMSIGSFVLTQMVLSQQRRRERALHLKIDELLLSKTGARDEIAGIEHKSEAEIEELRGARHTPDPPASPQ
jgi:low affinity Fe/Cu permease